MQVFTSGLDNIIRGRGIEMSITGMLIVFIALVTIALIISIMPLLLQGVAKFFPEKIEQPKPNKGITLEVIAAIGAALHRHKFAGKQ